MKNDRHGHGALTVGVFTPAYRGRIHASTAASIARDAFYAATQGWRFTSFHVDLGRIDLARNTAIRTARDLKLDLLLMVDEDTFGTDATPVLECLWKTMRERNAAVVGAVYPMRTENCGALAPVAAGTGPAFPALVGTGLMLIDMRKLAELPLPWFRFIDEEDGSPLVGEDYYFCEKVRRAGHLVLADVQGKTAHAGEAVAHGDYSRARIWCPAPGVMASVERAFAEQESPSRQQRRAAERAAAKAARQSVGA